ncbi:hypothetical protein EDF74_0769 [Stenotrophomonas rhizophila]|uniref:hypothetical protein n=1 Tax=Stenotrophomonas rhizophila TaxID=216778 RepID=UPI000F92C22A|nr:hypothetical protein [Stenotrophomonas rhizophila]ROP79712.1 hypothetical protein EDF74_0769 [Stenotrophomonas rhizophila]
MSDDSASLFPFVHRDLKVRGEYSAASDAWIAHFDLPRGEGGFQTVVHRNLRRSHGPASVQRPTAGEARTAAVAEIDAYLDRAH